VRERERERERERKLWKNVFSLVNSANFAVFWGNFLGQTCHTQFIFPNICHEKSPKDIEFIV
jgi:hypothetical protein